MDMSEMFADEPRQAARAALKRVGLPASYEVGVLANVIKHLRSQLESAFGIHITEAVFAASHLAALYQDDLEDTAFNQGIRYVTPMDEFHDMVWETSAAYAGHGLGLCEHWRERERCWEENARFPEVTLLALHYSRSALTVSLAPVNDANSVWEPDYRHVENFTLGRDAAANYYDVRDYWADVRRYVVIIMENYPGFSKPEVIMITGDAADAEFMENLEEAMMDHMGRMPEVISDESVVVAAKGAAEFMRRGPAPWSQ
jgi:hypothetical protein